MAGTCTADVAQDFQHGLDLVKKGDCNAAIPVLSKVADTDPALAPQALNAIADCHKKKKNWAKAVECYSRLLKNYPDSVAPDREVRSWIMDCHLANNEVGKYQSLRQELLDGRPSDVWKIHFIVGKRRFWRHEYSEAVRELTRAVDLGANSKSDPEFIEANKRLVQSCIRIGEWDEALELANKLGKDYPDQAYQWQCEIGRAYCGRGEYEKAIPSLETAAKLIPEDFEDSRKMFKALLKSYYETSRFDEAIALAQKLGKDDPEDPGWGWELGRCYVANQEYEKAVPVLEGVIESSKAKWEVRSSQILLGQSLFKLGRGEEALEDIERYYRDKPELWDAHLLAKAAVLFYGQKDAKGCLVALQELLTTDAGGKKSSLVPTATELMYKAVESLDEAAAVSALEALDQAFADAMAQYRSGSREKALEALKGLAMTTSDERLRKLVWKLIKGMQVETLFDETPRREG